MGCSTTREKLESKMLMLKLRRVEIKQERQERIKDLQKITGKEVSREPIPDYVDHSDDEEEDDEDVKKSKNKKNKDDEGDDKKKKKDKKKDKDKDKDKDKKKK